MQDTLPQPPPPQRCTEKTSSLKRLVNKKKYKFFRRRQVQSLQVDRLSNAQCLCCTEVMHTVRIYGSTGTWYIQGFTDIAPPHTYGGQWGGGGLQKHSCQKSRVCNVSLLLPDKATETHTETNIKCILPQRDHFFPCNFKQWAFSLSASKNNDLHDRSKSISTVMPINTLNSYVIIIKKKRR